MTKPEQPEHFESGQSSSSISSQQALQKRQIEQIKEVTGGMDEADILKAIEQCRTAKGKFDSNDVVQYLLNQAGSSKMTRSTSMPVKATSTGPGSSVRKVPGTIDLSATKEDRDLQEALAASLQESSSSLGTQMSDEDRVLSSVLEASLRETSGSGASGVATALPREPENPFERKRVGKWPVGLKNVGNTCWFSVVIQSLFYIPYFRHLVLTFPLDLCKDEDVKERASLQFMSKLRSLFVLLVTTERSYLDPSDVMPLLRTVFAAGSHASQQDVSEFQTKLIDWLEDAFLYVSNVKPERESEKQPNPIADVFYGKYNVLGKNEGTSFETTESFGQFPLQLNDHGSLVEALEGATSGGLIESVSGTITDNLQEVWFTRLPPVLTFELARFKFDQKIGKAEKIHSRLTFPRSLFLDRFVLGNCDETRGSRKKAKALKQQLCRLEEKLDRLENYGPGERKYPLLDVLTCMQYYVSSETNASAETGGCEVAMETQDVDHEASESTESIGDSGGIRDLNSSDQQHMLSLLKDWHTDIHSQVERLRKEIERLKKELNDCLEHRVKSEHEYFLHAVLVHEGQATSGHYWAYILADSVNGVKPATANDQDENKPEAMETNQPCEGNWYKFNDVRVTRTDWATVQKEASGGRGSAAAYCLVYVNSKLPHLMQDKLQSQEYKGVSFEKLLAEDLQNIVMSDRSHFRNELQKWEQTQERLKVKQKADKDNREEKLATASQCTQTAKDKVGSSTISDSKSVSKSPCTSQASSRPTGSSRSKLPDVPRNLVAFFQRPVDYSNILLSVEYTATVLNKLLQGLVEPTPDQVADVLRQTLQQVQRSGLEVSHLTEGAEKCAKRAQSFHCYLISSDAPAKIVKRAMLEEMLIVCCQQSTKPPGMDKAYMLLRNDLQSFIKEDRNNFQALYQTWQNDFVLFRWCLFHLMVGMHHLHEERPRTALSDLVIAWRADDLLKSKGWRRGINVVLLKHYMQQALLHANNTILLGLDHTPITFSASDVTMLLPALICLNQSRVEDDQSVLEEIRNRWCSLVEMSHLPDSFQDAFALIMDLPDSHSQPLPQPEVNVDRNLSSNFLTKCYTGKAQSLL